MSKKVIINKCFDCPHYREGSRVSLATGKPKCQLACKDLPIIVTDSIANQKIATGVIPAWCPLEDNV